MLLGNFGEKSRDAVPDLIHTLESSFSEDTGDGWIHVRAEIAMTLGEIGDPRAIEPLIKFYVLNIQPCNECDKLGIYTYNRPIHRHPERVLGAMKGLMNFSVAQKDFIPLLIKSLQDDSERIRWEAATTLGFLGARDAIAPLTRLLNDPSNTVRAEAAKALGKFGGRARSAYPELIRAIKHPINDSFAVGIQGICIVTLGEIGATEAIPFLKSFYLEANPHIYGDILTALRRLGLTKSEIDIIKRVPPQGEREKEIQKFIEATTSSIKTLTCTAVEISNPNFDKVTREKTVWIEQPDKRREQFIDEQGVNTLRIYNGSVQWEIRKRKLDRDVHKKIMVDDLYTDPPIWSPLPDFNVPYGNGCTLSAQDFKRLQLKGIEEVSGEPCYKLVCKEFSYWISKKDGLIRKVTNAANFGSGGIIVIYKDIKINVPTNSTLFDYHIVSGDDVSETITGRNGLKKSRKKY